MSDQVLLNLSYVQQVSTVQGRCGLGGDRLTLGWEVVFATLSPPPCRTRAGEGGRQRACHGS